MACEKKAEKKAEKKVSDTQIIKMSYILRLS